MQCYHKRHYHSHLPYLLLVDTFVTNGLSEVGAKKNNGHSISGKKVMVRWNYWCHEGFAA